MYLMCSLVVVIACNHKIQVVHKHFQVIYQASSMFVNPKEAINK